MACRERDKLGTPARKERVGADQERVGPLPDGGDKRGFEVALRAGPPMPMSARELDEVPAVGHQAWGRHFSLGDFAKRIGGSQGETNSLDPDGAASARPRCPCFLARRRDWISRTIGPWHA